MQLPVRSSLAAGFAVAAVAAGGVVVAPQAGAGVPRSMTATVNLAVSCGFPCYYGFDTVGVAEDETTGDTFYSPFDTAGALFEPTSVVYVPDEAFAAAGATGEVGHPLGLIPQVLGDAMNPVILKAILSQHAAAIAAVAPRLIADLLAFGSYANAAAAVVGLHLTTAVLDTITPTQWGGGKVFNDWVSVGNALQAMTIGIGAVVDGTWVPSLRIAAVSSRNQVANDILESPSVGSLESPNYAAYYTPVGCSGNKNGGCAVLPVTTSVSCGPGLMCGVAEPAVTVGACGVEVCKSVAGPAASRPAAARTARRAAGVTSKSVAAAAPKAAAARARSAR